MYGFNQDWFGTPFKRKAGCGPTAAAMLLSYLNRRDHGPLIYRSDNVAAATLMLEDVWKFVTPGFRGLDSTGKFVRGLKNHAWHYKTPWVCRELALKRRASVDKVVSFVEDGLASDCPVAFLNLDNGRVPEIDRWHWFVLTALEVWEKRYLATGYDGGRKIVFDLGRWVLTTKAGGGFVYLDVT